MFWEETMQQTRKARNQSILIELGIDEYLEVRLTVQNLEEVSSSHTSCS